MSIVTEKSAQKKLPELNDRFVNVAFFIILTLGLCLRFYFYLANRDLGADEAHLALNFIHLGYIGLTHPLENFQSAPIFFLWSVETITRLAGYGEMALRFVPFVFSVLTFPFFFFFVRDLTKNRIVALVAFLLFALNWSVIYFATELKPYTLDIAAFILIGFLIFSDWAFVVKRRFLLLAIIGSVLLLFSISTVIILFCAGIYMTGHWLRLDPSGYKKNYLKKTIYVWVAWASVFLINYALFIYKHPYAAGMKNIWSWAFCPIDVTSPDFRTFISARLEDTLFTNLLFFSKEYYFSAFLVLIFFVFVISIFLNRQYNLFLFSLFPLLIHLLLSMLQVYPFFHRFILYLLPPLILLFTYGVFVIVDFIVRRIHWSLAIIVLAFFVYGSNITSFKKYAGVTKEREIKPILKYIDQYYPENPILVVTPYTLYRYYYETGFVKNKNFKAIDWELKPEEFQTHHLVVPLAKNYLLFYSVGDDCDGYGETLRNLKLKGKLVRQFGYSIFGISEIKPEPFEGQGKLVETIDYKSFNDVQPSIQGSKSYIPLWNNIGISHPVFLKKGKYALLLTGRGEAVNTIFPHLKISIGQKIIGDFYLRERHEKYKFVFEVDDTFKGQITIAMDNDEILKNEDRNAFIENIFIFEYGLQNVSAP